MVEPRNAINRFFISVFEIIDGPVTFFREKIVEPNQKKYPYYHQKFQRVPTIDECYTDDHVCKYEANEQFIRDRSVDSEILNILRRRHEHCIADDYTQSHSDKCKEIYETYLDAAGAWFCKYGDIGPQPDVLHAFMKQKHRMIWERRHGPVGSGMKEKDEFKVEDD